MWRLRATPILQVSVDACARRQKRSGIESMVIDIKVDVQNGRVRVHVPQVGICQEFPGLAAYDTSTGDLLAFGESKDDLLREVARETDGQDNSGIEILSFSSEHFSPGIAVDLLLHCVMAARNRSRPGIWSRGPFLLFRYEIQIPGYEDIPKRICSDFEYRLLSTLKATRNSLINGQRVRRLWWKHSRVDLILTCCWIALLAGLFNAIFWGEMKAIGVADSAPVLPLFWTAVLMGISLCTALSVSMLTTGLIVGVIWTLITSESFSTSPLASLVPKKVAEGIDRWLNGILR
jgi:hypothetical protein